MKASQSLTSTIPEVNAVIAQLSSAVQEVLGDQFVGMYLYGSLALGDFDPHKSDIDFLVATAAELTEEQMAALQAMHLRLYTGTSKWVKELEGSYIPLHSLWKYDPAATRHPHIDRGSGGLQIEQHDTDWVVQRYSLREYGLTLAGPNIKSLIDPISPDELRQAVLGLMWWWQMQLDDPSRVAESAYQAYAVLSMCRILYTLRLGAILSKPAAARWALKTLDPQWAGLIKHALAWQPGQEINRLAETLEFIRYTFNHSRRPDLIEGYPIGENP